MRESMSAVGALSRTPWFRPAFKYGGLKARAAYIRKQSCVEYRPDVRHPRRGSPKLDGHYVAELRLKSSDGRMGSVTFTCCNQVREAAHSAMSDGTEGKTELIENIKY